MNDVINMNKLRHSGPVETGSSRGFGASRALTLRSAGIVRMTAPVTPGAFPTGTPDALDNHRRPRIE